MRPVAFALILLFLSGCTEPMVIERQLPLTEVEEAASAAPTPVQPQNLTALIDELAPWFALDATPTLLPSLGVELAGLPLPYGPEALERAMAGQDSLDGQWLYATLAEAGLPGGIPFLEAMSGDSAAFQHAVLQETLAVGGREQSVALHLFYNHDYDLGLLFQKKDNGWPFLANRMEPTLWIKMKPLERLIYTLFRPGSSTGALDARGLHLGFWTKACIL